ncbi:MAG: hypothetical protein M1482_16305 [Chloroflexi bacterium]|nr:hypothetical protein [Chloroflexota bacterium]
MKSGVDPLIRDASVTEMSFDPTLQNQLDSLIHQGLATIDPATRAPIYSQLNALSIQNALDIFVDTPISRRYEQQSVQGWFFNPIYQNANTTYYYVLSKGQQSRAGEPNRGRGEAPTPVHSARNVGWKNRGTR